MKKYIMAIDQGTTSSRCILFDKKGNIIVTKQKEFTQIYPNPGWVEHNPMEILDTVLSVTKEALLEVPEGIEAIDSIGITNQRETTIMWDKRTGQPVYNAIVWQCRRTADMIEEIKAKGYAELITKKTGLIPDAYFSASKIAWILNNVEGVRKTAQEGNILFGTVDTWIMWNLTKGLVHATDYTNASRTMIYNIHERKWDEELLELFDIPQCILPKVEASSHIYGMVDRQLFGKNVAIAGVAGDQQAALFGQCCWEKGEAKNTYGTGCFLLMNTGDTPIYSNEGLITTIAAGTEDEIQYVLEGSVFVAGAAIQWLRDSIRIIEKASESELLANSVENSNGIYVVPAFTGLGAPYWDQEARGMVIGITRGCEKAHFVRATLEAIAYQTYDVIKAMERDSKIDLKCLKVDGGASANDFLIQFQSDILNTVIHRPNCVETTALGAAYLAGLATGWYKDKNELKENWQLDREYLPSILQDEREGLLKGWHRAIRCALEYGKS